MLEARIGSTASPPGRSFDLMKVGIGPIRAGIGMVFQHFKLVENFTVLENVVLGAEDSGLLRPSLGRRVL